MRTVLLGVLATSSIALASGTHGNGVITEESRNVSNFTAVEVGHGIHATVTAGKEFSARLKGDENLLSLVTLVVKHGTLKTEISESLGLNPTKDIELIVTAPKIDGLEASGGADITIERLTGDRIALEASGGGEIHVGKIEAQSAAIECSGGGEIDAKGTADQLAVESSGGGEAHLSGLTTRQATVDASGGGDAELTVSERLVADATGGGTIHIHGNPAHRIVSKSGGGEVDWD